MKSIVVLAALLAIASAVTTDVHINTTSTSGNSTGHNATTSTSAASTTAAPAASTTGAPAASTTGAPASSTTGAPASSTTGSPLPANVTITAITTIWETGVGANASNACGGNVTATFTATFTTAVCAFYPIQVPGVNASVKVYWFGETATMTLWLRPTDVPNCEGTPAGSGAFTNGGCDHIDVHVSDTVTQKVWVTSRWGASFTTGAPVTTTTTTSTTGDAGAGSTIVPSFVAMLFATLLLVARFF